MEDFEERSFYFTKEQLANTPSRKSGLDADKELSNRQQAANFIQDMGQRLQVTQLCINTAIVYMHRFYVFHSFEKFHRNAISTCALFLAAKIEEQPRKLEHVIRVAHVCLHRDTKQLDTKSEAYAEQAHQLVINENVMLQTLGFDIAIDHPHTYVVKCCQLVRASKDLAQTSYFMATNSLHLTTMCLQHRPTVVACVCIHLACKWSNWEIPKSSEGKEWFWYVDKSVSLQLLEELTSDFLAILDKCPSRLKRKIMSGNAKESQLPLEKKGKADIMLNIGASSSLSMADHDKELESLLEESRHNFMECAPVRSSPVAAKPAPLPTAQVPSPSKKQRADGHAISLQAYRDKKEKSRHEQKTSKTHHDLANSHGSLNNNSKQQASDERHQKAYGDGITFRLESSPPMDSGQLDSSFLGKFQKPMLLSELFPEDNDVPVTKPPTKRVSPLPPPPVVPAPKVREDPSPQPYPEIKANKSRQPKTVPHTAMVQPMPEKEKVSRSHRRKSPASDAVQKADHAEVKRPANPPTKHERKERHNRPHNAEKAAHNKALVSAGSLKITIPKDKIILKPEAHTKAEAAAAPSKEKSPREALKLKIPKHKLTKSATVPPLGHPAVGEPSAKNVTNCTNSLKLVITKDRLNSGTYSTSKKSESRKREGERTTEHSKNKVPRVDQHHQQQQRHHTNGKSATDFSQPYAAQPLPYFQPQYFPGYHVYHQSQPQIPQFLFPPPPPPPDDPPLPPEPFPHQPPLPPEDG